ncbi:MAG: uridine phosphorylase [Promethearchaeota archaeon]
MVGEGKTGKELGGTGGTNLSRAGHMKMERQYHVGLARGELANYVLLCGAASRARRVAERFDEVEGEWAEREYLTITGKYAGRRVSVMGTGMGTPNVEIAVVEMAQIQEPLTLVRVGSCGALQERIALGDLVVSTGAVRLESTSLYFVDQGYPSVADYEVVLALVEGCAKVAPGRFHVGITASASGFYGAQGRDVPGFPPREDVPARMAKQGVLNFEMESSTLFTLASLRSVGTGAVRAGTVCAVYASRPRDQFVDHDQKVEAEGRAIDAALESLKVLWRMDDAKARAGEPWWRPGLGLSGGPEAGA